MSTLQRLGITYIQTKLKFLSFFNKKRAAAFALKLFLTPQTKVTKELPFFNAAEPVSFTSGTYTIRGYRFKGKGEHRVILLHGFTSASINFEKYIQPLLDKGFEVLALDAPAHGISSGKMVNALSYKNMVKDAVKQLGPVRNFITHSFGGLAVSLAMEELEPTPGTKIVLIAPAAETPRAITNAFATLGVNDSAIRNEFDRLITEISGKGPEWYSVNRALSNTRAQILIVQDEDDEVTPLSDLEPLRKSGRANIQFHITRGLGHNKIYRDKDVIEFIVNFIAG